jgi:hypothetical protein
MHWRNESEPPTYSGPKLERFARRDWPRAHRVALAGFARGPIHISRRLSFKLPKTNLREKKNQRIPLLLDCRADTALPPVKNCRESSRDQRCRSDPNRIGSDRGARTQRTSVMSAYPDVASGLSSLPSTSVGVVVAPARSPPRPIVSWAPWTPAPGAPTPAAPAPTTPTPRVLPNILR